LMPCFLFCEIASGFGKKCRSLPVEIEAHDSSQVLADISVVIVEKYADASGIVAYHQAGDMDLTACLADDTGVDISVIGQVGISDLHEHAGKADIAGPAPDDSAIRRIDIARNHHGQSQCETQIYPMLHDFQLPFARRVIVGRGYSARAGAGPARLSRAP